MTRPMRVAGALAGAVLAFTCAATALAQQNTMRVRAEIEAVQGNQLRLKDRTGKPLSVTLGDKLAVSAMTKVDIDAVKPGNYIGIAARPQADGRLEAIEVQIFPEPLRGVGEGHRKWDLSPDSTMTNATVEIVVSDVKDRVITLKYKGGEQKIVVPPQALVIATVPGDPSLLKPGNHVFFTANRAAAGGWTTQRIAVGKDGLKPAR